MIKFLIPFLLIIPLTASANSGLALMAHGKAARVELEMQKLKAKVQELEKRIEELEKSR